MDEGPDTHAIDDIFANFTPPPIPDPSDPFAELFSTVPPPQIPVLKVN